MDYSIKFDRPSMNYNEGLPCGNGRMGAMVLGGTKEKQILINEETVWYGGPRDRNNPDALKFLEDIRRLMLDKKTTEAERLSLLALTGMPESQRHYSTLGMIVMDFYNHNGDVENYCHRLDFRTASVETSYCMGNIRYSLKVFVSQPDQVLVIQMNASEPVLDFFAGIERGERVGNFSYGTHMDKVEKIAENGLLMKGNCGGEDGLFFRTACFGISDGEQNIIGDKLVFNRAKTVTLYLSAGTNYEKQNIEEICIRQCKKALEMGFDICYGRHLEEWHAIYEGTSIELTSVNNLKELPPMNKVFDAFANGSMENLCHFIGEKDKEALDDYLILLAFHYGRYLLASCSRNCILPANLQGIWCRDLLSIWDGKFTTNINLQMSYWPADAANLGDCFRPYFDLCKRIRENGTETARRMYGCRGFVLHNNTDIWADTAPQDMGTHCTYWFAGGLWIAADMWEHYRYTKDVNYLADSWPILRDAARFILDYMIEDKGELVTCPSSSPESAYFSANGERNSFCIMPAMDIELCTLVFNDCLQAMDILVSEGRGLDEIPETFTEEICAALKKMRKIKIDHDGTIMEWTESLKEAEPGHRHQSHLIGAYPYNQITEKDEELFEAVRKTAYKKIENGGFNTGWSRAWGAGIFARLGEGDMCRDMLAGMVRHSCQPNLFSCCNIGRVPKLMEDNMPIQIEGNMGTVQAVIEMLIQSHDDNIVLLPSLPASWAEGNFKGLVARGNVLVSAWWEKGKLTRAVLVPRVDGKISVKVGNGLEFECGGINMVTSDKDGVFKFDGQADREYCLVRKQGDCKAHTE